MPEWRRDHAKRRGGAAACAPWMQTIPDEFTNEVYRVHEWKRTKDSRGPRYAGKLIRQLIYERMPKPVLPALDELNPTNGKYQRKRRHHQFLAERQGLDHFRSLVITVMTLLRISKNKGEFKRDIDAYFGSQLELYCSGEGF
ncbi:MAG: P63C domain-containing protein [Devosia sp.]